LNINKLIYSRLVCIASKIFMKTFFLHKSG